MPLNRDTFTYTSAKSHNNTHGAMMTSSSSLISQMMIKRFINKIITPTTDNDSDEIRTGPMQCNVEKKNAVYRNNNHHFS